MKPYRTLTVIFDNILPPKDIIGFRGAIVDKVGRENILFHNHLDNGKFVYKYPLIQYKSINGKPGLFCIGDGVDQIHRLFMNKDWSILIKDRELTLKVGSMDLKSFRFNLWEKNFTYCIFSWMGLNPDNYQKYLKLTNDIEKASFLENILIGNILSMSKGLGWTVEKKIEVRIKKIIKEKSTNYKNTRLKTFDLEFTSNVSFPSYIGLGKGVSVGYGTLKLKRQKVNEYETAE